MLTRLKVSGFKNLVDVDVYFGPFTCVAGGNGVGKSNLFDAIQFLSALADRSPTEAAMLVRDKDGRTSDIRHLFHRVGEDFDKEMHFEVEMIVPRTANDDLGQEAVATSTFLQYALTLAYRVDESFSFLGSFEIIREDLNYISEGDASEHLPFKPSRKWLDSVVVNGRYKTPFISTNVENIPRVITRHQDGKGGRPLRLAATNLKRTILSSANAAESPTATVARREMQSWRQLQLEPSALRKPSKFIDPTRLGDDGSYLAATLYHLARAGNGNNLNGKSDDKHEAQIYTRVANSLLGLIDDVRSVWVDRDDTRELLTVQVKDRSGTSYPALALSDGTLRFLALSVLEQEPENPGLICLEEPENGIHPDRIPAMLRLIQDIATDIEEPVDASSNPLRQVIVNTHSPVVVSQGPKESFILAESSAITRKGKRFTAVSFSSPPNTWRAEFQPRKKPLSIGKLLSYLNPTLRFGQDIERPKKERVIDMKELQQYLPGMRPALK
jgi:predicted ATPase